MVFGSAMILENGAGRAVYQVGKNAVSEGTITALNSPITIDVATTLSVNSTLTNGNNGYIANDSTLGSPATLLVEISHTGSSYQTQFTIKQGETFELAGWDIAKIKLTRGSGDCAYRVHCW